MKIIAIGDIHGVDSWKTIVATEDFDKLVFIGDYFDSFQITLEKQLNNFLDIVQYKRDNMDKVVLLFGNHDYHYMNGITETCSGYQAFGRFKIEEILEPALKDDLIQMCYKVDNLLFTHAGVSEVWAKANDIDLDNIEESINDRFKYKPVSFQFTQGRYFSNIGDDVTQTPIWIRPKSLRKSMVKGYIQIVGHTAQDNLVITDDVVIIDTLTSSKEYLKIEDGKMTAVKINKKKL